jgi:riboflavin kinase/FMN adenylyltransferase
MTESEKRMTIFRTLAPSPEPCALALGMFDGLHTGHRQVLSLALAEAARGLAPAVFTFEENPKFRSRDDGALLTQQEKIRLLAEMGFRRLYLIDFEAVRGLAPEDFVRQVLRETCRAETVCCGFNYTFGRGGKAGPDDLRRLCAENGIRAEVAPPVLDGGEPVSSSRIRTLLREGEAEKAARLLGRPFGLDEPVVHGRRLGRTLGTPTINQQFPRGFLLPRFGVYVSLAETGGNRYCGVTNVGVKPTVGSNRALAETWMPDYGGPELYGRTVRVSLLKFLRPEKKFPNLQALQSAITQDGESALEYFRANFPGSGSR